MHFAPEPHRRLGGNPALLCQSRWVTRPLTTATLLDQLLQRYREEGVTMAMTMEEFRRYYLRDHLQELTPEERLKGLPPEELLKRLPPEERLKGLPPEELLKRLPPEERLKGLPPEELL